MLKETTTMQPSVVDPRPLLMIPPHLGVSRRWVQTLKLFRELSESQCSEILSHAVVRKFMKGELILVQGEPVRGLILLQTGIVKHTQTSSEGQKVLLRVSSCGDVLNVHDMLSSCFHTSSVLAMEKCEALVWEFGQIECLIARYPQLGSNFDRLLAIQLEELEERFREIATETVARRLALLLVRLCDQVGRRSVHGLRVSFSREELAQMTGATQYTVSRLLVRWAEQGLLFPYRKTIVVNDTKKLALVKDVERHD
jgi:CRP-like cAMP-binding protein